MRRVDVQPDDALGLLSSRVQIKLRDGRTLVTESEASSASSKFSIDETARLVRSMAQEMRVPQDQLERLIDTVYDLEHQPEFARLLSCLQNCAAVNTEARSDRGPLSAA
jgi:hypothetical protein